jgi:hypothetical protein
MMKKSGTLLPAGAGVTAESSPSATAATTVLADVSPGSGDSADAVMTPECNVLAPLAFGSADRLQVQATHAQLVEPHMVRELVTHRAGHLIAQQLWVVTKVAAEGIAKDHDPVMGGVARGSVALV